MAEKVALPSERIRERMDALNIRQADLSRTTGVPRGCVSNYMSGRYEPKAEIACKFAEALACDEMWIMGYDVPMRGQTDEKEHGKDTKIKEDHKMARECLTDEEVEMEIARLQRSPHVKLAEKERRVRNRRRMYLYGLRQLEKKGRALEEAGVTSEVLDGLYNEAISTEED